jgi:transcriptional regulator with XRE-family HTH domain
MRIRVNMNFCEALPIGVKSLQNNEIRVYSYPMQSGPDDEPELTDLSQLGPNIAAAIERSGRTQAQISRDTKIAPQQLNDWKQGRVSNLTLANLLRVAAGIPADLNVLVKGVSNSYDRSLHLRANQDTKPPGLPTATGGVNGRRQPRTIIDLREQLRRQIEETDQRLHALYTGFTGVVDVARQPGVLGKPEVSGRQASPRDRKTRNGRR